jgi:hypothetical protein
MKKKKEIDFFHKFFPVSLVEKIVAETNAYAVRCIQVRPDKVWVPTTFPEMMAFLGTGKNLFKSISFFSSFS